MLWKNYLELWIVIKLCDSGIMKKNKMTHAQPTQNRFIIQRIVNWLRIYIINYFILIRITISILSGSFFRGNVRSGDGPKLGGFGASVPLSPCCPERSVRILQIFYNVWIKLRTFQRFSKIFRKSFCVFQLVRSI